MESLVMIHIVEYQKNHQASINEMMINISSEFEIGISSNESLKTPLIPDLYWVALMNGNIIGTVGLSLVNDYAILKRMFIKKEFRGASIGVSNMLLKRAITYCVSSKISEVYLGTMAQFIAAQRFYLKNGFDQILENELPSGFMLNPLDSVFFRKVTKQ
jgi:N-acetylglutamate synthase-like GNAT family acetyltransferase